MAEHTPWQQGRTLMTAQTREWSADEWLKNDKQEKRRIFAHFTNEDQGRGREFIAECRTVEHAEQIVREHNAAPDLLEALKEMTDAIAWHGQGTTKQVKRRSREARIDAAYTKSCEAIEKAGA